MKNIIRAFQRIPERNRTIAYGFMSFITNLCFFVFKIAVGIIFNIPLLIAIAIYNLLIGLVKANCSRGLWKNKDDLKDLKTYILGGSILSLSSICYIIYNVNLVGNPYGVKYNTAIAVAIGAFAAYRITISIYGLFRTKGRTLLIKEYKFTNFATALNYILLTQMAILSLMPPVKRMNFYNALLGTLNGIVILAFGLYLIIHGLIQLKLYTTGITNKKNQNKNNSK